MTNTFKDLGLSEKTLISIEHMGYQEPTPVQEQAIPFILAGRDVVAAAQTGTGKTAAFMLPILNNLGKSRKGQGPLCLVITPTRELAQQIDRVSTTIAKQTAHRTLTVVGGTKYDPQIRALKQGVDVLVATPGRLIDLCERKVVNLKDVEVLVLDEADRMLDMGFMPSVKKIIAQVSRERQTLLFSATLNSDVMTSVSTLLKNPEYIEIARRGATADTIEQLIMPVEHSQKPDLLAEVLKERGGKRVLVFTRTKSRADACAKKLAHQGFRTRSIHADRSQSQREHALEDFRNGKIDVLVATDVLARGIDISDVSQVYNFDVPNNPEDYVHRIGRTGRAGESGYAITFVGPDEISNLREIEYLLKTIIPTYDLPGFPYSDARIVPAPDRSTKKKARTVYRGSANKKSYRRR
jgi:ATP-dependent RNA helicase RhlE